MADMKLQVTLWPNFPHFLKCASDPRISGIRLNSAMMNMAELEDQLGILAKHASEITVPLFYDIKGRQLRVAEVQPDDKRLIVVLNHPIEADLSIPVLFKAGTDCAVLERIEDDGRKLVFKDGAKYGPHWEVKPGESLHIRHPSLRTSGPQFTQLEKDKIERVKRAGFKLWYLSYVQSQRDVDEFVELVGIDAQVYLKIESKQGLDYVSREFKKRDNLTLVAARGDLYVEIDKPHEIVAALRLIIKHDPKACVGSRFFLTLVKEPIPECADFLELGWLYDTGYREFLLCDEICLKENLLWPAVNAFSAFRDVYTP